VGDKTMLWYSHWDTGGKLRNMEIGLATMRRDGFGYLSRKVPHSAAHFLTETFEVKGKAKLFINVKDLSSEAPLLVELYDEFDRPVPAFSGANTARVTQSGTRQQIKWSTEKTGGLPSKLKLSVRVNYPEKGDPKVFALYVGK
jgi:hypothetical protein